MSKFVYIAHTPYQVMSILNIISQIQSQHEHFILMSHHNLDRYVDICENYRDDIKATVVNVFCTKAKTTGRLRAHFNLIFNLFKTKWGANKLSYLRDYYDFLFVPSDNIACRVVFHCLRKVNPNLQLKLFDDGIGTYDLRPFRKENIIGRFVYSIFLNKNFSGYFRALYCYQPDLISEKPNSVELVKIECSNGVKDLFVRNISISGDKYIGKKVIFLDQGLPETVELLSCFKIIEKFFKKDEILVKMHPRVCGRNYLGYETSHDGIPLELLSLVFDFSDTILVTYSSGGCIMPLLLFGENGGHALYLIQLCNYFGNQDSTVRFLERFRNKFGSNSILIPLNNYELDLFLASHHNVNGVKQQTIC